VIIKFVIQKAQKRISEMDGEKSENDLPILFQRGAAALPPKELLEEATWAPHQQPAVDDRNRRAEAESSSARSYHA
jgi:hypothetical protein